MRKRLLAVFLACCMAASTASTVFAADDLPALTEPPAVAAPADPDPPAAEEVVVETEVPDPTAEPAPETTETPPDSAAEPTPEPVPTEAPAPEPTAETTPEPTAEPAPEPTEPPIPDPTAAPTQAPAGPEPTAAPTPQPTAAPLPTVPPAPTASPTPLPTASPVSQQTAEETKYAAVLAAPIPEPTAVPLVVDTLEVEDTISTDGCFTAVVNGSAERQDVTYTWYRSHDGQNWEQVTPRICTGSEWNITEGSEHKLNAAIDSCIANVGPAERLYYKVEVTGFNGTKAAEARVPYHLQLQNGSFESPSLHSMAVEHTRTGVLSYAPEDKEQTIKSHFAQLADTTQGLVWHTTGLYYHWTDEEETRADKTQWANYIEIVDGTNHNYNDDLENNDPRVSYNTRSAQDGNQFAELNCEAYGALYQDVLTVPGSTLNWSLAHKGRNGADTMVLLIAPVTVAEAITKTLTAAAQNEAKDSVRNALNDLVEYNGQKVPISTFMVGGEMTDGIANWATHKGTYQVPGGQYVSRFFFLAVQTQDDKRTEGNLLDNVWFSTDPAPAVAGRANLTIRKTITGGLTVEELTAARANLTFTVANQNGTVATIHGADMTVDSADPTRSRYTLTDLPLTSDDGSVNYTYTVEETGHDAPAGLLYLGTQAAVNGDNEQTGTSLADITLTTSADTTAEFRNIYARPTGSLHLTKAVADEAQQAEADAVTNTFTVSSLPIGSYTLQFDDGTTETRELTAGGALTIALKGLTGVTLKDIPVNRYTVTETAHPDLANYYCTTTADDAAAEVQVMSGQTAEVTITNSYAPFLTLTITKQVTGGLGDARREFPFTATVAGQAITAASAYVTKGEGAALTGSGFTLRHRGSITIGHLRPGDAFTVTETDNTGYETSFDLDGSVEVGASGGGTLGAQSATLTCVNNKDGAPPTGFGPDTAPAVWMLLCALLGLVCLRRRKGA